MQLSQSFLLAALEFKLKRAANNHLGLFSLSRARFLAAASRIISLCLFALLLLKWSLKRFVLKIFTLLKVILPELLKRTSHQQRFKPVKNAPAKWISV
jgi:hypothetical protein